MIHSPHRGRNGKTNDRRRRKHVPSTTTETHLSHVARVVVLVSDTDKAIDFYVEKLGFDMRVDVPMGNGYRWVEVGLPGGSTTLAIVPPPPDGESKPGGQTGVVIDTDDIDASHRELKSRGVDVDAEISRLGDPVPPMFWFRDLDGNALLIVEPND
jgi:catechol 2,3-dioxygenase-like lactoylglutathione lyase family enzyme